MCAGRAQSRYAIYEQLHRAHKEGLLAVDSRALPPRGKLVCFMLSYLLMLYVDGLLTLGSWKQAVLTFGDTAPASGISVGLFFYSSGLVFGVSAAVILLVDLVRVLSGSGSEEDPILVKESDEHT